MALMQSFSSAGSLGDEEFCAGMLFDGAEVIGGKYSKSDGVTSNLKS